MLNNASSPRPSSSSPSVVTLLRLIAARADGTIGGATVDAKIDELTARLTAAGRIVAVLDATI